MEWMSCVISFFCISYILSYVIIVKKKTDCFFFLCKNVPRVKKKFEVCRRLIPLKLTYPLFSKQQKAGNVESHGMDKSTVAKWTVA